MYVRMYVCMYVCMYGCMYACMYVCMYVCMYICMYAWMHVCMYICTYVRTYVRTHARTHARTSTYARTYGCVYVCVYMCVCVYIYTIHDMHIYIYIYIYALYMYIYIYIYREIEITYTQQCQTWLSSCLVSLYICLRYIIWGPHPCHHPRLHRCCPRRRACAPRRWRGSPCVSLARRRVSPSRGIIGRRGTGQPKRVSAPRTCLKMGSNCGTFTTRIHCFSVGMKCVRSTLHLSGYVRRSDNGMFATHSYLQTIR